MKKSWLPFLIFVSILVIILFGLIYGSNLGRIRAPSSPEPGCVVMKDRGDYKNSIDIVFLAENYDSVDIFVEDTEKFMNSFLEVEPYSEYESRFNFFRIESLDFDLGCDYSNDAAVCDPVKVKTASLDCPYDYPVVLVETKGIRNFFRHLRSSSWRGIASINSADNPLVFAHEAGHQMSGLLDEYTWEGGKIIIPGPNCDSQINTCPKFKNVEGAECHKGCINNKHSRPIEVGIMRNYWDSNLYGVFDEHIIEQAILDQSASNEDLSFSPENSKNLQENSQLVNLIKYSCVENSCNILEITQGLRGYPSDPNLGKEIYLSHGDYKVGVPGGVSNYLIIEGYNPETKKMEGEYIEKKIYDVVTFPFVSENVPVRIFDDRGNVIDEQIYTPREDLINSRKNFQIISPTKFIDILSVI